MDDQTSTALATTIGIVPERIETLIPELAGDEFADVREMDAERMQLQGQYEVEQAKLKRQYEELDGGYLLKMHERLMSETVRGSGLWTRYLRSRAVSESTARRRIALYQSRLQDGAGGPISLKEDRLLLPPADVSIGDDMLDEGEREIVRLRQKQVDTEIRLRKGLPERERAAVDAAIKYDASVTLGARLARPAGVVDAVSPKRIHDFGSKDKLQSKPAEGPMRHPVQLGSVWQLGRHRVLCGDSTNREDVAGLMQGEMAATLVTSPPYWTGQEYDNTPGTDGIKQFMRATARAWSGVVTRRIQIQTGQTNTTQVGDGGPMEKVWLDYLWTDALRTHGWLCRHRRVWAKGGPLLHNGPVGDLIDESWELILTYYRPGYNEGGQERVGEPWAQQGVWDDIVGERGEDGHPCAYPVELVARLIRLYSLPGDIVVDPFLGSGSTLLAAEGLGRRCYGMEINPRYVDVCLTNWEAATDREAVLLESGGDEE